MKKTILLIVSIVAALCISVGSTFALLQSTGEVKNTFTVGKAKIEMIELERDGNGNLCEFTQDKPLLPAVELSNGAWTPVNDEDGEDSVHYSEKDKNGLIDGISDSAWNGMWDKDILRGAEDKFVFVKNTGSVDLYFRTFLAFEDPDVNKNGEFFHINKNENSLYNWEIINDVLIDGTYYDLYVATYTARLTPGEVSIPSLLEVGLDMEVTGELLGLCGDKVDVLAFSEASQADGFLSATEALETAFGKTSEGYTPWN